MKQPHFEEIEATLTHLSLNRLKQGRAGAAKPGATISVTISASNELLDMLDPEFKPAMFKKPGRGEQLELGADQNALVALRLKGLAPLRVEGKWERYEIQIAGALEGSEELGFVDATVKDFELAGIEGGSVKIAFKASFPIEEDETPALTSFWMNQGIKITLTPPAVEAQSEEEEETE